MGTYYVSRAKIKQAAKQSLKGNWGKAIGAYVVVTLISVAFSFPTIVTSIQMVMAELMDLVYIGNIAMGGLSFLASIAALFIMPALQLGLIAFFLKIARDQNAQVGDVFSRFSQLLKCVGLNIMIGLKVFLWSLLFVIPGIIAAYRYSMAFYILADNPDMGVMECIDRSSELMRGHKLDLFILELSFIGWELLCGLTFGIGILWLAPYMSVTTCNFYRAISNIPAQEQPNVGPEIL